MTEEEQEKLYELLFKDTKNKLEIIIEKQQKEIEELKEKNAEQMEVITEWVNGERINDIKHISKDKIREKIKELEHKDFIAMQVVMKHDKEAQIKVQVLEELLEE